MVHSAHLQAGADELDNVAVVAGAQDEYLAAERLRIPELVLRGHLVRENLHGHYLDSVAHCLVHLVRAQHTMRKQSARSRARLHLPVTAAMCVRYGHVWRKLHVQGFP